MIPKLIKKDHLSRDEGDKLEFDIIRRTAILQGVIEKIRAGMLTGRVN